MNAVPFDPEAIAAMKAPLNETGRVFLPGPLVWFLTLGALSAGLTSFNAASIAIPREIFSQARDRVIPAAVGEVNPRTGSPVRAVAGFFGFVVLLILLGQDIDFYGVLTAVGILGMTAIIAIAAVRLPAKFPERYEGAYFKVPKWGLIVLAAFSVLSCVGFVVLMVLEMPLVLFIYAGWTALWIVYYLLRVRALKARGVDWDAIIAELPGHDEE